MNREQNQENPAFHNGSSTASLPRHSLMAVQTRFLLIFIPLTLLYVTIASMLYQYETDSELSDLKAREKVHISISTKSIQRSLEIIMSDLEYLTADHRFAELFEMLERHRDTARSHTHSDNAFSHLESDWLSYSIAKPIYDQIRFIDSAGKEQIRINKTQDGSYAVPSEKLQNKSDRYYFLETFSLIRGETFLSPMDLNVEQGVIETPLKPMLRAGRPIFDSDGNKRGIVILNYLAENLLDEFEGVNSQADGALWMVNNGGYWLKGPASLSWGFMLKRQNTTMDNHYPDAWHTIQNKDAGQFEDKDGIWTFATVYPLEEINGDLASRSEVKSNGNNVGFWKIVLRVSPQHQAAMFDGLKNQYYLTGLLLELVFSFGCLLLARAWSSNAKANTALIVANEGLEKKVEDRTRELNREKEHAEHLSLTDPLTELNNRRSFFDQAEVVDRNSKRYGHTYTAIMLDIDHFKVINDTHGHQTGDIALKKIADSIIETIRESDIAGRIGGEEFSIILPETNINNAVNLAERLRKRIADIELINDNACITFTASLGVAELLESDQTIDSVLERADTALYKAKNSGRDQVRRAMTLRVEQT